MTLEEWDALDEEIEGELVDGYLVEEEVPTVVHEIIVHWLVETFAPWLRVGGGIGVTSGVKYGLADGLGRKPDYSVFFTGHVPPAEGLVQIPPDIAVEIVSRAARDRRRDRVEKYGEYARFGIRWYWIVDPKPRTLEIFALGPEDRRYASVFSASTGAHGDIPGCPGLRLDLDDLWCQVDRIERRS
jgi:Uma2 family endonuclease